MSNLLLLSIVIPVYNIEKYIAACIESIENTYQQDRFEIICVNDGSTDHSQKIIANLQKKYSNIRLINQDNAGVSKARNAGALSSRGKFIWYVDGDDYLVSGCMSYILSVIEKNTENIPIVVDILGVDEDSHTVENKNKFRISKNRYKAPAGPFFVILPSEVAKKSLFDERLSYGEDYYWTFLLNKYFNKCYAIKPCVYCYRRRSSSAMNTKSATATERRLKSFLILHDCYEVLNSDPMLKKIMAKELSRRKRQCIQAC